MRWVNSAIIFVIAISLSSCYLMDEMQHKRGHKTRREVKELASPTPSKDELAVIHHHREASGDDQR